MKGMLGRFWHLVCRLVGRVPWRRVARVPLTRSRGAMEQGTLFLEARIVLWFQARDGSLQRVEMLVDSGAQISILGVEDSEGLNLPVPSPESAVELRFGLASGEAVSLRLRPGMLVARFTNDLNAPFFRWPVRFQEGRPLGKVALLGLAGVIADSRWIFDGTPQPDAPFGVLTIDVRDQ
jgi:hypothetical protein